MRLILKFTSEKKNIYNKKKIAIDEDLPTFGRAKLNCGRQQAVDTCGWLPKPSKSVV